MFGVKSHACNVPPRGVYVVTSSKFVVPFCTRTMPVSADFDAAKRRCRGAELRRNYSFDALAGAVPMEIVRVPPKQT
jgi:hypothetical protein